MLPNLLNMAMQVVGSQQFDWIRYVGKYDNGIGEDIVSYAPPITVNGQVQAVPKELFEKYGLEFQKKYLLFYVSKDVLDIDRDVAGDKIEFGGKTYQCLSETDWFNINGWVSVIAAQIEGA